MQKCALLVWCPSYSSPMLRLEGVDDTAESWVECVPRMINCFSARSLPRETSSSMDSHIPFELVSLVPGFLLVVVLPPLLDWP